MEAKNYGHKPVLLHECLEALCIRPDGIYVDGTLGRAGHSLEIAKRLTGGRLIGIDRDETAITAAKERLAPYGDRVTLRSRRASPRLRAMAPIPPFLPGRWRPSAPTAARAFPQ